MCEYCQYTYDENGERNNQVVKIKDIVDGSMTTRISLWRYANDDGHRESFLKIERFVIDTRGYASFITDENIHIEYCPFCGEKL